ncbi:Suppressor/enhancer of lin-12 protein 9 [Paragonimus heterotremus]|uniref:Suppressor/enhancer of lin-12 protein 9 n=1 Tax=Paragonimus heterotremus TaxID=100268 RepID=A0A8J4WLE1_9TREM|nr:Suppressor/enhancer of lin-12 protein 9 [Paragonimus heterotremus]
MWLLALNLLFSLSPCLSFYVDIDANAEECFYERVTKGQAVILHFEIYAPDGSTIYSEVKKANGRPKFIANKDGDYKYCFGNKMSSLTPKVVLFDMEIEEDHLKSDEKDDVNQNTNFRVVVWAAFEALLIITMSVGQVFYLKRFFEVRRLV